jgi:predicted permease
MNFGANSIPHFEDLRERTRDVFTDAATWTFEVMSLSIPGQNQRVMGAMVSPSYFSVLGANAVKGRTFVQDEETGRGAHPVAVLSYPGWRGFFGSDPDILGRSIVLNGQTYAVVGVMAEEFAGPMPILTPTLWVPLMQLEHIRPGGGALFESRGNNFLNVFARLRSGVTLEQAEARIQSIATSLQEEYPESYEGGGLNMVPQTDAGIHPSFRGAQVGLSSVVMAVVLMLLLIACLNVANLFLARARDRSREMAVRLSLGARRSVLITQLLTESLVFAGLAGVVGLGLAWWVIGIANRIPLPMDFDFTPGLTLSPTVLGFTLGVSLVTGLLFGIAPALQATSRSLVPALKGEAPAGESRSRMSRGLVVAQMSLSIVLLVASGLFLRNLRAATALDKGFVSDNLLFTEVDPSLQGYDRARSEDFFVRLTERLQAMPMIQEVSLAEMVPLGFSRSDRGISIPDYEPGPNESMSIHYNIVSPGYFEAMGISMVQGRGFTAEDDSNTTAALVVNQRFVDAYWPGQNPIGKIVRTAGEDREVIGVVPTGKYVRLGEEPTAFMYLAQRQVWRSGMTIHIRTAGDPNAVVPVLRDEVAALDPNMPLGNIRSATNHLGISLMPARLAGGALGVFGVLGLILASVGVYGVMSYSVSRRTREIGIRMAVGSGGGEVVRLLMRQGMALVVVGVGIGLVGAFGAARVIRGMLYGEGGLDPITFIGVPVVLIAVAMLAIWVPARRASSVDPVVVLRQE